MNGEMHDALFCAGACGCVSLWVREAPHELSSSRHQWASQPTRIPPLLPYVELSFQRIILCNAGLLGSGYSAEVKLFAFDIIVKVPRVGPDHFVPAAIAMTVALVPAFDVAHAHAHFPDVAHPFIPSCGVPGGHYFGEPTDVPGAEGRWELNDIGSRYVCLECDKHARRAV